MKLVIRIQQVIYFLILVLWGQAAVQYAFSNSFGNRFMGASIFSGASLVMLVISYVAPKYLAIETMVLALAFGAIVAYIMLYL